MFAAAAAILQDDGLTFAEFVQNIPHDGPAFVIYIMLAVFCGLIWAGSRRKAE